MKNFSKYGTILTRSEAKEIKGGGCDENDNYHGGDPEAGSGGGGYGLCTGRQPCSGPCQFTSNGRVGNCFWSSHNNICACNA